MLPRNRELVLMALLSRLLVLAALLMSVTLMPQPVLSAPDKDYQSVHSYIRSLKGTRIATQLTPLILKSSRRYDLNPMLVTDIMRVESYFHVKEVSSAGAIGLMQVMPVHFKTRRIPKAKWFDPATNIDLGCRIYAFYKREMKRRYPSIDEAGLRHRTLVAYNMGPRAVTSRGITRSRYSRVINHYYQRH